MLGSLEEYAAQHPAAETEEERAEREERAQAYTDQQAARQRFLELKESIMQQLQQGAAPEIILYHAIEAIGTVSKDPEYTRAGQDILSRCYDEARQQSLLIDTKEIAARKLEAMREKYNADMIKTIRGKLKKHRQIERGLLDALQALNAPEDE